MTLPGESQKNVIIEKVVGAVGKRLEGKQATQVADFLRALYERVPPDEVISRSAEAIYGSALAMWRLAQERTAGTAKVAVFTPRVDQHGWHDSRTAIALVNDDMPFLVDSVSNVLSRHGIRVHVLIHPVLWAKRSKAGTLGAVHQRVSLKADPPAGTRPESLMYFEIDEQSEEDAAALKADLEAVLQDVRYAVEDWRAMVATAETVIEEMKTAKVPVEEDDRDEAIALMQWMVNNHFTFLGYRQYDFTQKGGKAVLTPVEGSSLGVKRNPNMSALGTEDNQAMPREVAHFFEQQIPLHVTKANARSSVHRNAPLDYVGVKRFDKKGNVVGEHRFIGLFTSAAYNRTPRDVPYLRDKVLQVVERANLDPRGHGGKALMHILDTYPRDELFQATVDELYQTAVGIVTLGERPRLRVFARRDPLERFVSALVYVPREKYNSDLRQRFFEILCEAFGATQDSFAVNLTDEALARVQFVLKTTPGETVEPDLAVLEQRLLDAARSWQDDLAAALHDRYGDQTGLKLVEKYRKAFPAGYRESTTAQAALFDIEHVERFTDANPIVINFHRQLEDAEDSARLKLYQSGPPIPLSDCLPMLEMLGLKVVEERPYKGKLYRGEEDERQVWIRDFRMIESTGLAFDMAKAKAGLEDTFRQVYDGVVESDSLNRLILRAGLSCREVGMLRAYSRFLRQAGSAFSQDYMADTLAHNAEVATLLVKLFHARFDPAAAKTDTARQAAMAKVHAAIEAALEHVANLDEDRILRRFVNLMDSTLRTNFYQPAADGAPKDYISFKLDSQTIDALPLPRPMVEIFVYAARVEGTHLRFGKVARGGLRWSDRREDFRTEVLGLVKAQQVKNTVIVPVGSKGGFYPKRLPDPAAGRDAWMAEGIASYKTFLRGLLDVTDNVKGGEIVPPSAVVRHDADDPYLVVAADKGTATFSDFANEVSLEYGHWLGDAFASGGSQGYDHKGMGITARGAWESVKRHFREMGKDTQTEDFTAVGIGDMSGDVFGNGMLLSTHIRLVAAFNHLHIFVDPTPDAAKSFKERKRLFEMGRSMWTDYDAKLISKGGGIFDRKAKSIDLTPEIKKALDIDADKVTPNELIRHIVTAAVELLWFGGIGTYVKGPGETDADVGDRANDAIRVTGAEVRAKVVGEGGNLGMTQLGRIDYARNGVGGAGGRANTDAVDNSAGVDCSDHEVNIKILLGQIVDDGEMTEKQRNRLLADMTDEVADLVLRDNYLQSQSLSVSMAIAEALLEPQARFMRALERQNRLDRAIEFLPDEEEIAVRKAEGRGLTRPEMCVVLAYGKLALYDDLVAGSLPDDPWFEADLLKYFPKPLQDRFPDQIKKHQLRREIITTQITNSALNRTGASFLNQLVDITSQPMDVIAAGYLICREIFELREIWAGIEGLDNKVDASLQIKMLDETKQLLRTGVLWFARHLQVPFDLGTEIGAYKTGVAQVIGTLDKILGPGDTANLTARIKELTDDGVPKDLAYKVAALSYLASAPDLVLVANESGRSVADAGKVYFDLGERLGLDWLRTAAEPLTDQGHWNRLATRALIEDLFVYQRRMTAGVLGIGKKTAADKAIAQWVAAQAEPVERIAKLIEEYKAAPGLDMAMLTFAAHVQQKLSRADGGA